MSNEMFKLPDSFEPKVINLYELPPLLTISSEYDPLIFNYARSKAHRKYIAAQFILGQPFNFMVVK